MDILLSWLIVGIAIVIGLWVSLRIRDLIQMSKDDNTQSTHADYREKR